MRVELRISLFVRLWERCLNLASKKLFCFNYSAYINYLVTRILQEMPYYHNIWPTKLRARAGLHLFMTASPQKQMRNKWETAASVPEIVIKNSSLCYKVLFWPAKLISTPLISGRMWSKTKTKLMLYCEYPAVNSALSALMLVVQSLRPENDYFIFNDVSTSRFLMITSVMLFWNVNNLV